MSVVTEDTNIICTHVADTTVYNRHFMTKLFGTNPECQCAQSCSCGAMHAVSLGTNAADVSALHSWIDDADGKFHRIPQIASGARVLVTNNIAP